MIEVLLIFVSVFILVLTFVSGWLLDDQPDHSFLGGEEVIYRMRRHWIEFAEKIIIPVIGIILFLSAAMYHAVGGTFFEESSTRGMDFFNYLLIGAVIALGVGWFIARRNAVKHKRKLRWWQTAIFFAAGVTQCFLIAYRYDGGRILYRDPLNAAGLDLWTSICVSIALLLCAVVVYDYFDWKDDYLTLTTNRVQYVEIQQIPVLGMLLSLVLQRRVVINEVIQQMVLEDVQQVELHVHTYLEYWLERLFAPLGFQPYGTLTIQSLSPQRIVFRHGENPHHMQEEINKSVNEIKRQSAPDALLRRLIERDIYQKDVKVGPSINEVPRVQQTAGLLTVLFPPNPIYLDDKKKTIIWRPAWIYVLWRELRPIGAAIVVSVAAFYAQRFLILDSPVIFALWLPTILAILFWMVWIYLEYRNDQYILSTDGIIDIDKRPFGPESKRQATLNTIQNVTFDYNFVESLFHIGRVNIQTGGSGGKFTFTNVPSPYYVQDQINAYVLDLRRKQNEKTLRDSLNVVREYHNVQLAEEELLNDQTRATLGEPVVAASPYNDIDAETKLQMLRAAREQARVSARREVVNLFRRIAQRRTRGTP